MVRREALLEAGGFFGPYFFHLQELDLATRVLAAGWDVRYLPGARFQHAKAPRDRAYLRRVFRFYVRNHLWYLWLRYPADVAARRMVGFLLIDALQCLYLGLPDAWIGGVADAWRQRRLVSGQRRPIPRAMVARAELNRGRMYVRFLLWTYRYRVLGRFGRSRRVSTRASGN
jgi:GT2 family glycosyltransferase